MRQVVSKVFFFADKKEAQKTLLTSPVPAKPPMPQFTKSFLFLFFKKAALAFFLAFAAAPALAQTATITISTAPSIPISPLLYGVNYVWDKVPDTEFGAFRGVMGNVAHASLMRYLGGWGAEAYDWSDNTESNFRKSDAPGAQPGAAPEEFLATVPAASFVTPSKAGVANPDAAAEIAQASAALVSQYGGRVKYWEIGNEWWLQSTARNNPAVRARNLENYAHLVGLVAPAMKAANPSITIFATADWASPADITEMRQIAGPGWDSVDGMSLHTYCGALDPQRRCEDLPAAVAAVRAASGKQAIYASEWSVARGMNTNDDGIVNAALTVAALRDMAFAGIQLGAYWPPVKMVDASALVSADYAAPYATGIAFGWMSRYYEGLALRTNGDVPSVAARNGKTMTVIVPSGSAGLLHVRILLTGTGLHQVSSAEVLYTAAGAGRATRPGYVAMLPVAVRDEAGETYATFDLNPGAPGRGAADEIARVSLD
jgi:hypothetical protein